MKIGVPKEIHDGEKRVATTPEVIGHLKKLGFEVTVETGAGDGAHFSDASYTEAGATIANDAKSVWNDSDIILKVRGPELNGPEIDLLKEGQRNEINIWPSFRRSISGPFNSGPRTFKIISLSFQTDFASLAIVAPASVYNASEK